MSISQAEPQVTDNEQKPVVRLGDMLIRDGLITESDLEAALRLQTEKDKKIGESLLEVGAISEEALLPYLAAQIGCPAIRLREGLVDPVAIRLIPNRFAVRQNVLGLFRVRNVLTVACADPNDLQLLDEIENITGLEVRPVFAFLESIHRLIKRAYREDYSIDAVTADMEDSAVELSEDIADGNVVSIEKLTDGSPIINLVNFLIVQSLRQGASDIHIEPGRKHTSVRYRIDGQLIETLQPRRTMHAAIVSRIKVMGKLDIAERRLPQDGRCQVAVEGKEIDLRISTMPTVIGEKVVIRVLDRSRLTFNLDELGMAPTILTKTKKLISKPHGLLLVTGPTGSGKTTTLYSALELMKSVHTNIMTVEDPVEYQIEQINQVQTDSNRNFDFSTALRSMLRQDPDVIMVGEIRDSTTAAIAVQAALTGHLVLSTLHTNDSAGAITRLNDMGIDSYKIAAALIGVIAQRLVRKICPSCKTTYYPTEEYLRAMNYAGESKTMFAKGEGCRSCLDTGFKGRVGIYEVMEVDESLRELIARDAGVDAVRNCFKQSGGQSLLESGIGLAESEITSLEEVSRIALFE